ncbi:hypothetical protein BaRGS_00013277 [Batillaria attramentaria]|uniref:Uncharacterized protein n=1 Tax=Batillaria attramentaria TaxID=370345 RepID=A0ABD0L8Y8_9CAEN
MLLQSILHRYKCAQHCSAHISHAKRSPLRTSKRFKACIHAKITTPRRKMVTREVIKRGVQDILGQLNLSYCAGAGSLVTRPITLYSLSKSCGFPQGKGGTCLCE